MTTQLIRTHQPFSFVALTELLEQLLKQPPYQAVLTRFPQNLEELGIQVPPIPPHLRGAYGDAYIKNGGFDSGYEGLLLGLWWLLDFPNVKDEERRRGPDTEKAIAVWESRANESYTCSFALAIEALNGRYRTPDHAVELLHQTLELPNRSIYHSSEIQIYTHRLLGSIYLQGLLGQEVDYNRAAKMFEKASANDNKGNFSRPALHLCLEVIADILNCTKPYNPDKIVQQLLKSKISIYQGWRENGSSDENCRLLAAYVAYQGKVVGTKFHKPHFVNHFLELTTLLEEDFEKSPFAADIALILEEYHGSKQAEWRSKLTSSVT